MNGQVVLITGASGGLGRSVTRAFTEAGATVAASSRKSADFAADLVDSAQADALAARVVDRFGRIDALVHLAGGFTGTSLHETTDAGWDQMMNLNLRAAFHILRAVLPMMRSARRGSIVAIASRAAVDTAPGIAAYAASKAALVSLVRSAALENKDLGINVNAILPGTIDTEANREWGTPEDRAKWVSPDRIAALALFLVSDRGREINGAALPMYGAA